MSTITTYTIRFDGRTKEILLLALNNLHQELEQQVAQGGNENVLRVYDEVSQVKRGVLLSPGEQVDTANLEAETSETVEETPEEMYKSQEGRQS